MEIKDVTLIVGSSTPTYLGDPSYKRRLVQSISSNDPPNVSLLTMSAHIGTHVDAPSHLFNGADSIDQIPLDILVGRVLVVEYNGLGPITANDMEGFGITDDNTRVLFKTRNSQMLDQREFVYDYVGFTEEAGKWVVNRGIKLIGIDYLSVDAHLNINFPVHRLMLAAGVVVVEGLSLGKISAGEYTLVCLPMKLEEAEGAPARVILLPKHFETKTPPTNYK